MDIPIVKFSTEFTLKYCMIVANYTFIIIIKYVLKLSQLHTAAYHSTERTTPSAKPYNENVNTEQCTKILIENTNLNLLVMK